MYDVYTMYTLYALCRMMYTLCIRYCFTSWLMTAFMSQDIKKWLQLPLWLVLWCHSLDTIWQVLLPSNQAILIWNRIHVQNDKPFSSDVASGQLLQVAYTRMCLHYGQHTVMSCIVYEDEPWWMALTKEQLGLNLQPLIPLSSTFSNTPRSFPFQWSWKQFSRKGCT